MNKGALIAIVVIILIIVGAFVVLNHNKDKGQETTMVNYVQNGVSFDYPSNWGVSKASSNYSVAAISLVSAIDSKGVGQVTIIVEKHNYTGSLDDFINKTYNKFDTNSSYNLTSIGNIQVGNYNATQVCYSSHINGTWKNHKAVWFSSGGNAYVMLYSAPPSEFSKYEQIFDYIVSTFKVTR